MPLQTETIDFEREIQDLTDDMEAIAEEVSQMGEDTPPQVSMRKIKAGKDLETYIDFLERVNDDTEDVAGMPDIDTLTFSGLTSGEQDLVDDIDEKHENMRRNKAWVAVATREGPYLEHDPEDALTVDAVEETAVAVADLPRPFVTWAESKIGELSHLSEDRGNGFLALASEKARNQGEG